PLTQAAARYLYKLMAYKDEYEVARLLLKGEWAERVRSTFVDPQVKFNLHPPLLREKGLKSKLELGGWFTPLLGMLIPRDPGGIERRAGRLQPQAGRDHRQRARPDPGLRADQARQRESHPRVRRPQAGG